MVYFIRTINNVSYMVPQCFISVFLGFVRVVASRRLHQLARLLVVVRTYTYYSRCYSSSTASPQHLFLASCCNTLLPDFQFPFFSCVGFLFSVVAPAPACVFFPAFVFVVSLRLRALLLRFCMAPLTILVGIDVPHSSFVLRLACPLLLILPGLR